MLLCSREENALIANLGRMRVTTEHKDSSAMNIRDMHLHGRSEADILNEMMARSYTRFLFKLEDIQVWTDILWIWSVYMKGCILQGLFPVSRRQAEHSKPQGTCHILTYVRPLAEREGSAALATKHNQGLIEHTELFVINSHDAIKC